jgi:hypothetical protein
LERKHIQPTARLLAPESNYNVYFNAYQRSL